MNLDLLDFSKNQISFTGVENILYSFHFDAPNGRYIVTMNLSNNIIGDDGAEYIATSLKWGRYPHLKALDVSGNQITPAGHGYIAQALKAVNQTIAVTLVKSKEVSKAILKETMKGMLYIAKNNGITTNEMLTNDQTVEYCKKGGINVLKNIIWGGIYMQY
ncbi:hypothetical protein [Rickettsia endosymbiont of Rhinocyllus conicus]|uniref:hypothetical protein n=1 Tax=Rickettsia endosymbiont of Rhinocyllus conicus TaxID=3066252 RepID=UPI003132ADE8